MTITYRINYPVSATQAAELFDRSGIRRPTDDLNRIQTMLDQANLTITAWDGEALVGIGRALTDFSFCCYLSDLAVTQEYQREGIGREIINRLERTLDPEVTVLLLSAPEAMLYYPKVGFKKADNGWILQRQHQDPE